MQTINLREADIVFNSFQPTEFVSKYFCLDTLIASRRDACREHEDCSGRGI